MKVIPKSVNMRIIERMKLNMFKRIWTESRHFKAKDSTQNKRKFYR